MKWFNLRILQWVVEPPLFMRQLITIMFRAITAYTSLRGLWTDHYLSKPKYTFVQDLIQIFIRWQIHIYPNVVCTGHCSSSKLVFCEYIYIFKTTRLNQCKTINGFYSLVKCKYNLISVDSTSPAWAHQREWHFSQSWDSSNMTPLKPLLYFRRL